MNHGAWICSVDDLLSSTQGKALSNPHKDFSLVGTDTRQDLSGRLFIALKGERFDAHDFVPQAVAQGAKAVLVQTFRDEWQPLLKQASFVQVKDTLKGLQDLALFWRRKHKFKVIGITGSNGKTSTKEFTHALLRDVLSTHASKGSYNNHWGVPLSILEARPEHQVLVLEMGMNALGEIAALCKIAEPDIVTVTTVGRAHIGMLGSQANIAKAKEEIYAASPKALHVFNMDNEWTMAMQPKYKSQQILFSAFKETYDVHIRAHRLNWDGMDLVGQIRQVPGRTWVHVMGRHHTTNLMAACSLALAAGLSPAQIWTELAKVRDSAWGRTQRLELMSGTHILFDAYNANPDSMNALFKIIYEIQDQGKKYLVVGDMGELGEFSEAAHVELGEKVAAVSFDAVWYVGRFAKSFESGLVKAGGKGQYFHSEDFDSNIAAKMLGLFKGEDMVAIKASRAMKLERVLAAWPVRQPTAAK